ncbi:MAG: nickel pincer cofactor biosynthesis protein LarC [Gemmatimonadales bacterium]|nr:nickel pincer cofactor biosynthesis protein LarC [Gemmatimonadales bacterium]
MKILRVEPFSGLSGDMFLGALLDLGASADKLQSLPAILGLAGASIRIDPVDKCGIRCTKVTIVDDTPAQHRHLSHIVDLIGSADLPENVKALAGRIFNIVGEAEAAVHGIPVEKVHFHEVGAIDSILDIVGAAVLLAGFEFDGVVSDPICTGSGFVDCAHGRLPVPAPATGKILQGLPIYSGAIQAEMTTPTGAAILKALDPVFTPRVLNITQTGYGAGSRDFEQPNCLRLGLGESVDSDTSGIDRMILIQTNLDDTSGELLGGHFQDLLLAAGALDVNLCPLLMKKGRPGQRLEVLCREQDRENLSDIILAETTTIGLRWFPVQRTVLPRKSEVVPTRFGEVRVKCVTLPSGRIRKAPEFEDCRKLALAAGVSVQEVMFEARDSCPSSD